MDINPHNYPNKQPDRPARVTFKCLNCQHFWAKEFTERQDGWRPVSNGTGGIAYYTPAWKITDYAPAKDHHCPECSSSRIKARPVHGKFNQSVPCDRRCTHAKGHNCECSCGGQNHGSAYQVQGVPHE